MKSVTHILHFSCRIAAVALAMMACVLPIHANEGKGRTVPASQAKIAMKTLRGDINGDGDRTVADVMLMVNYIVNGSGGDNFPSDIADMNVDHDVTIMDVMMLVGVIMGNPYNDPDNPTLPIDDDVPGGDPSSGL